MLVLHCVTKSVYLNKFKTLNDFDLYFSSSKLTINNYKKARDILNVYIRVAHYHYFKVMGYFRPGNVMVRGIALM